MEGPAAPTPAPSGVPTAIAVVAILALALAGTAPAWLVPAHPPSRVVADLPPWGRGTDASSIVLRQATRAAPAMAFAVEQWLDGRPPLWNPHVDLGRPTLAEPDAAAFHPFTFLHVLAAAMDIPRRFAWALAATLTLFFAGLGTHWLAGRLGAGPAGRLLAAASFMLGGGMVGHVHDLPSLGLMMLPWSIGLADLLAARVTPARIAGAAVAVGLAAIAAHPMSLALCIAAMAAWALLHAVWLAPGRGLWSLPALALAIVVGVAAAGVQVVPLVMAAAFPRPDFSWWHYVGLLLPLVKQPQDSLVAAAVGWAGTIPLLIAVGGWSGLIANAGSTYVSEPFTLMPIAGEGYLGYTGATGWMYWLAAWMAIGLGSVATLHVTYVPPLAEQPGH